MGENLVLNMVSKGFQVSVFNRTTARVDEFLAGQAAGKAVKGTYSLAELAASLERPRRIMLMVKAGQPVDDFIAKTAPLLSPGDILIDGGNSHYPDTIRRSRELEARGLLFIGTGVSGGEEGALKGPAIMPGGHPGAWPHVKPIFQSIAAKVADGSPCCDWIGTDGAGHFVKMVHNGIEYGDMQLICEVYHLLSQGLGLTTDEMHAIFAEWNRGVLDSYLIEITRDILAKRDEETGVPVVDLILDAAGQKGTGKWTSQAGLDFGVAIPTIAEAVFARCLSAIKEERVAAARSLRGPRRTFRGDKAKSIAQLHDALYASKICSYAQGYQLMRAAAAEMDWKLDYGRIAQIWRGGCIIRAQFLDHIRDAFARKPKLANLLLDPYFKKAVRQAQPGWRKVLTTAIQLGIPCPAMSAALSYYDGYRCARLPANLLQAQRDYFGAHTYERVDHPRGVFFHTNWTGEGGATASTAYTV